MDDAHPAESFFSKSPALIFFFIALAVFASEATVMLLLHFLPPEPFLVEAFADASLLVILISPALYFLLFRPMVAHIHERQRIENKLHKNKEEQFKIMVRTSLDGFLITDKHGRFLEVNDAYRHMLGYSREELLNMGVSDVEAVEAPEDTARHIGKQLETGSDRFETCHRRKDGSILGVEVSMNYSDLNGGRIYCFLRDITARKQAESALRKERDFIQAILDTAGTLIVVLDRKGHIVRLNKIGETLTGYSFEEICEQPFWDIFLLDNERAGVAAAFDRLTAGDIVSRYENHWRCKDGSARLFDWHNTVLLDDKGDIEYLVGIGNDITERKLAEKEKDEVRRNQRALLNAIQETTFLMEKDGTILVINEIGARRLNAKPEELTGKIIFDCLPPKAAASRRAVFEKVALNGKPEIFEDERSGHRFFNVLAQSSNVPFLPNRNVPLSLR